MKEAGKLAIGGSVLFGLAIGAVLLTGYNARKRGWTRSSLISKTFNVPHAPNVEGLEKKYRDLEEQQENIAFDKLSEEEKWN